MTNKCECCEEKQSIYNTGGYHLCKACNLLATRGEMKLVKETILTRQKKKVEKQLSELKNG